MEETLIEVNELTAAYRDETILSRVSFEVRRGEVFVILGGSGCGKSTLLKHMIGLLKPVEGRILIEGRNIATARGEERVEILRGIGVTYQNGALFGDMTLRENVMLPMEEHTSLPREAMELAAAIKLKMVGLSGYEEYVPAEISGGMRKRAAIARAIALDPKILFLDEPSAGLDPITSAEVDQLILRLAESLKITFVIVSHELESVYSIADNIIMLDKRAKGIVAKGTPRWLRDESPNLYVKRFLHRDPSLSAKGLSTQDRGESEKP